MFLQVGKFFSDTGLKVFCFKVYLAAVPNSWNVVGRDDCCAISFLSYLLTSLRLKLCIAELNF